MEKIIKELIFDMFVLIIVLTGVVISSSYMADCMLKIISLK